MKRFMALLILGLLVSGCAQYGGATTAPGQNTTLNQTPAGQPPASAAVTIKNFAFSPAEITVKQGTMVTWTNEDSVQHTVKSQLFESPALPTGGTYQHTFDAPGEYPYACGIHPSMQGKVIVTK